MAGRRLKVRFPDGERDAIEVSVKESTERWTEVTLDDGTRLKIKPIVISVVRAEGAYDQDGNPMYQVRINQVMAVDAPPNLRKDAQGPSTEVH